MEHVHTEERVSSSSRYWLYYCKECNEYLGKEDKPPVYSVYLNGWEGSMRVWYAPDFDTPEEAEEWMNKHEWDEGRPRVELVYNY
jgi:hypothetical protein